MRTETRIFAIIGGFLLALTAAYAALTAGLSGSVERVGTVGLAVSFLLCAMIGGYFWLVSRRIPPRPEDRLDADPADSAGDVGFFSPYSYWPLAVGIGAATAAFGIAVWELWIVAVGLGGVVASTAAMLFQYYSGAYRGGDH
jgi:hypothetical protein